MIRYRRLYEDEEFIPSIYIPEDVKLYDVVNCAGYEWFVIDIKGDIVTLLAKIDFGACEFNEKSNDYKNSEIRKYLINRVLPRLESANPVPTRLDDVEVTDKVWLLSTDEAEKLSREIREFDDWWYWLRSPGYSSRYDAAYVDNDGVVNPDGDYVWNDSGIVRPAMRVRIEDLD